MNLFFPTILGTFCNGGVVVSLWSTSTFVHQHITRQWDWKFIAFEGFLIGLLFPQALHSFQRQEVWACSWSQSQPWLQELKLSLCFVFIIIMQIKMGFSTPGASVIFHFILFNMKSDWIMLNCLFMSLIIHVLFTPDYCVVRLCNNLLKCSCPCRKLHCILQDVESRSSYIMHYHIKWKMRRGWYF